MARIKEIVYLNPRDLEPDNVKSRTDFGDLVGLAETIREHGVLQPLGVTETDGAYRVVYGNRRREAAIVVGLDVVPCVLLQEQDAGERLLCQVLENVQRKSLNDMEQGIAFRKLRDELAQKLGSGVSATALNEALAKKLGLSPRTVQRYISLCDLPAPIQDLLRREEISVTHVQHLHSLADSERKIEVAQLAAEEGLSAAEMGRLCAALARNPNIAVTEARDRLRLGEAIEDITPAPTAVAERIGRPPKADEEESDSDIWDDEGDESEEEAVPDVTTADGNRRYLIRSLDSFMDELARLVRCVESGDFARFVAGDAKGNTKVVLAMRQLAYLSREIAPLVEED